MAAKEKVRTTAIVEEADPSLTSPPRDLEMRQRPTKAGSPVISASVVRVSMRGTAGARATAPGGQGPEDREERHSRWTRMLLFSFYQER